ncbi:MAG: response regulator transcription factor [Paludibacterium sp.]|uniref:LytR/AlgR family response regulator transcription factor n=1 Tax=Paludibacterium sp. TaxID=1917523 RepID=UPI0025FDB785|nr:LytTR family DNA-binding domain-containing protein [Paludibacterium sp.]MBV8047323.1 response regulator transcription factor [Paludibacterium sp.]MBV8648049.1 response regulator transcription factor [Paludibacterium sp.]
MTQALRALIADDEALARQLIHEYLRPHPDVEVVGECENGMQTVRDIGALAPDLVFLDIRMPRLSGLEVLELTGRRSGVIFTTAYDEHALQAFDLHAVDYLLKPFSQARFDEALAKARRLLGQPSAALESLVSAPGAWLERVLIRDRDQVHVVAVAEIAYVEAQDDYIAIHAQGKTYLKTQRLADIETRLDPSCFVRVHRSYLINLAFLRALERQGKDGHAAVLADGSRVPVSRAGYERVRAAI